jgi:hypothetical protein
MRKRLAYLLRSCAMKLEPTVWDDCIQRVIEQTDQHVNSPEFARHVLQSIDRELVRGSRTSSRVH